MQLAADGAPESAAWAETAATKTKPTKSDQDQLDACICLVSALHLAKGSDALFVGCRSTGYIIVPNSEMLRKELDRRCLELEREATSWVRAFRLSAGGATTVLDAPHAPAQS
jgi:predicted RNase H-like nuclease